MRIGITDSGVGGLSVCAALESRLAGGAVAADIELLYLNAAQDDDYAYNSMPNRQAKLTAFDEFLNTVHSRYRPDLLFIACNSLSVLYADTVFARTHDLPVMGVIETGMQQMRAALAAPGECSVLLLATPTTVETGTYSRLLVDMGLDRQRVVEQACPGLADAISNDFSGKEARALLQEFIPEALSRFSSTPERLLVFLGCTHYGYQSGVIEAELKKHAAAVRVLNPNPGAADAIVGRIPGLAGKCQLRVRFLTRYAIPEKPLRSLPVYLGRAAPATLRALLEYELDPALCGSLDHLERSFT
jgi:glutamate racemase